MKKIVLLILVAVSAAIAPVAATAQFRYGPMAGVNLSTLKFKDPLTSVSSVVDYTAGLQAEMMFPGIGFGIDMGIMYNQLGAKVNLGEKKIWASQGYGDEHVYLHYIQIPLHLRFKWTRLNGLEDYVAPFVYGGPDFTLSVGHGGAGAFDCSGGELGLTAGVGVEVLRHWQVSGAYVWGMTYALKTKLLDDYSARNRHWSVRVAYLF